MQKSLLTLILSFIAIACIGQQAVPDKKKGSLYFAFGSHRTFYSRSDISLIRRSNPSFDFTLYDVKAKDEGGLRFHTAPQFSYHIGYYFTKKNFGLEYHYDHIKYFMQLNQRVRLNGSINGKIYNTDTLLQTGFVELEHSDGGNYAMVNFVKRYPLAKNNKGTLRVDAAAMAGVGVVNPKTNTTILGNHRDDQYHISGYIGAVEGGLKLTAFNHVYFQGTFKGAYANYAHFLIAGGHGHQTWFSAQFIYVLGAQFDL